MGSASLPHAITALSYVLVSREGNLSNIYEVLGIPIKSFRIFKPDFFQEIHKLGLILVSGNAAVTEVDPTLTFI